MIAMVAISIVSFANGTKPNIKVETVGAKTVTLNTSGFGFGETQIKLRDDKGSVLHSEKVSGREEYLKNFDLSSLKMGTYYFEVENEMSFATIPVELSKVSTYVLNADKVVILKPVIRRNGNFLDILLPSETPATIEVAIYDSNANRVFREKVKDCSEIRRYDISRLTEGDYRIKLNTNGKEFIQFVAVK